VVPYLIEEAAAEAEGLPEEEARREAAEICSALLPYPQAERRRLLSLATAAAVWVDHAAFLALEALRC